uniref:Uncharacterized protein n=1 Tax=Knipowitschia caucasica TaxID=637954 RepID=A0AAV2LXM3_KNICA
MAIQRGSRSPTPHWAVHSVISLSLASVLLGSDLLTPLPLCPSACLWLLLCLSLLLHGTFVQLCLCYQCIHAEMKGTAYPFNLSSGLHVSEGETESAPFPPHSREALGMGTNKGQRINMKSLEGDNSGQMMYHIKTVPHFLPSGLTWRPLVVEEEEGALTEIYAPDESAEVGRPRSPSAWVLLELNNG